MNNIQHYPKLSNIIAEKNKCSDLFERSKHSQRSKTFEHSIKLKRLSLFERFKKPQKNANICKNLQLYERE